MSEYLLHFLRTEAITGRLGEAARGVGIHHIGVQRLESWSVPVAPTSEQRRIVAAIEEQFSRLDAAQESLRRAKRNLARLRAAALLDIFRDAWPVEPLASITDPERPVRYGILMPKEHVEDGVLYVRVKDYPKGKIALDGLRRTSPKIAEQYRRSTLKAGDVLLAIRGTYGRVALVPSELDGGNVTQDTARIAPLAHVDARYLAAYLASEPAQRYFRRVARGVAVKGVNIGDLRTMPIPLPPVEEQKRIVEEVERQLSLVDAMATEIESALRRSAILRRSILERAFTGKLVPQDPSDEPVSVLLERIAAERAATGQPRRAGRSARVARA